MLSRFRVNRFGMTDARRCQHAPAGARHFGENASRQFRVEQIFHDPLGGYGGVTFITLNYVLLGGLFKDAPEVLANTV